MKRISSGLFALLILLSFTLFGNKLPEAPNPPRLVNDFSGLLKNQEVMLLEQKLVNFAQRTSVQIGVIIVDDLLEYEPAEYADRVAEKWGFGHKSHNNGVLIVVKPSGGQGQRKVHIAIGYGLESVIPDATAKQIVEREILPRFREGQYYQGLDAAAAVLMQLAQKEYSAQEYAEQEEVPGFVFLIPLLFIIIFFMLSRKARNSHYHAGKGIPLGTMWWLMSQGNRGSSGSWGNFSSGSGPFGGGGGFGGFGGGRFGGGGAGGSW